MTMRILVADDNRDAADTLVMLLEMWGHEVRVAYDGLSALKLARHFKPQVALLDIQMPRMNGGDVARNLRHHAALSGITIVATSASDPDDCRLAEYRGEFDAYLPKPCDSERLEELLDASGSYATY
jgi:CheY-like chemotaxis protein